MSLDINKMHRIINGKLQETGEVYTLEMHTQFIAESLRPTPAKPIMIVTASPGWFRGDNKDSHGSEYVKDTSDGWSASRGSTRTYMKIGSARNAVSSNFFSYDFKIREYILREWVAIYEWVIDEEDETDKGDWVLLDLIQPGTKKEDLPWRKNKKGRR